MEITRNDDGTLVVPVEPERVHRGDDEADDDADAVPAEETTRVLHPGEGGYDEALAEWDAQQHPESGPAVSTANGRRDAMNLVNVVAQSPDHAVSPAVAQLDDPSACAEALRHVLAGGVHSVEDFAAEVAEASDTTPLPAHEATKVIGEILAELD